MLQRINQAQPAIWSSPSSLQIGLAENKIDLEDLTLAQQKIVASLYSGILAGHEEVVDNTVGAALGETKNLVARLTPMLQREGQPAFGPWQEIAFAEIARAGLDYKVNGEMVLAERWLTNVHIDQLDKSGLLLCKALLSAGVGKVLTHDQGLVLRTDLGELGYPKSSLGLPRIKAANELIAGLSLPNVANRLVDLSIRPDAKTRISFAVVVGHLAMNPRTYSRWLSRDVSHLGITFDIDHALISPVVIPGQTACLNCIQEEKVDGEQNWPVIATQLLGLPRVRDDAAALLSCAGLACRSILRRLDEQAGFEYSGPGAAEALLGYKIDYSTGNIKRQNYAKHKLCSCQLPIENTQQND